MSAAIVPTTVGDYRVDALIEIADSPKETAALLRTMLRRRTGLRFSVRLGRGTASHHLDIATGDPDTADEQRAAFDSIFDRRPMGHPMTILLDRSDRIRTLAIVAGADPAAEWLDIVAPPRSWDW